MQIDAKYLSEENYTNPRLIEVTNKEAIKLYNQILAHQEVVNPHLERCEAIEEEIKKLRTEMEGLIDQMKEEDQKASKLKEKLVPMLEEEIMPHLGELDEFVGLIKEDNKTFAKINDRIEEWVKAVREQKKK